MTSPLRQPVTGPAATAKGTDMLKNLFNGRANKFLVGVLTAVNASLTTYFGSAPWVVAVTTAVGAVATYLVSNAS